MSSGTLIDMKKRADLSQILASNLKYFMDREGSLYKNPNALAKASKVSANTVRNFLDPKKRTVTTDKAEGFPTLDKVQKIADALNCQVWELLHPDLGRSLRERAMYALIEKNYANLPPWVPRPDHEDEDEHLQ